MKMWLMTAALLLTMGSGLPAAESAAQKDAELRMLRSTVTRQQEELSALRAKVTQLTAKLKELGVTDEAPPATSSESLNAPSTQPEKQAKPKSPSTVFVLDFSGSMIGPGDDMKRQVAKAIHNLAEGQMFNLVIAQNNTASFVFKGLRPANGINRNDALALLSRKMFGGNTDLSKAIDAAARLHPQVVWLATDGDFPDNAALLRSIRQATFGTKTHVNTTTRWAGQNQGQRGVLQKIAEETGGILVDDNGKSVDLPEKIAPMKPYGQPSLKDLHGPSIFDDPGQAKK